MTDSYKVKLYIGATLTLWFLLFTQLHMKIYLIKKKTLNFTRTNEKGAPPLRNYFMLIQTFINVDYNIRSRAQLYYSNCIYSLTTYRDAFALTYPQWCKYSEAPRTNKPTMTPAILLQKSSHQGPPFRWKYVCVSSHHTKEEGGWGVWERGSNQWLPP